MTTMDNLKFETEVCGRCGGSGRYSYNQIDGDRCYGCNGKRICLTKRGAAAKAWAEERREIAVTDVKVGQRIFWGQGGRCTVTAIDGPVPSGISAKDQETGEWVPMMQITFHGRGGFTKSFYTGETVRLGWTDEMIDEAMAHQDSLTKAGKPRASDVE